MSAAVELTYPVHCRSEHCHSAVLNVIVVGVTDPKTRLLPIREHVRAVIISQSFYNVLTVSLILKAILHTHIHMDVNQMVNSAAYTHTE